MTWDAFATAYPELFAKPSLLSLYYTDEALKSDGARRLFVMPDRSPAPARLERLKRDALSQVFVDGV